MIRRRGANERHPGADLHPSGRTARLRAVWILVLAAALVAATGTVAAAKGSRSKKYCSNTARLQLAGCMAEIRDDRFVGEAVCLNDSDPEEAAECRSDVKDDYSEGRSSCREQFDARIELCGEIGEERYDPSFDPEDFETGFTNLNPYYPVAVGNSWRFQSEEEEITIHGLDETKLIDGVTCLVVRDVVRDREDGKLIEDTLDWYGQRSDGTVDYCGEEAKDYESFEGDVPMVPELVEIEGSFKAGRDGDKAGTLFMGTPVVGAKYRQEFSPSNAEDVAEVLSTTYRFGRDARFDPLVPQALVELMCGDDDCVVTADTSPLEPDVLEYKFYSRGIGVFLELKPDEGEVLQLVECNTDPKCASLPIAED